MIGWLLDTNVVTELGHPNGSERVKAWSREQVGATIFLSVLTLGEHEKGIAQLVDDDRRRLFYAANRDEVSARFAGRILPVSDPIVRRWGTISGRIKRDTGHPPPVIDTLLAATAIEHDLYLATRNVRDVRFSGAAIFNPWDDDPATAVLTPARRR